MTWPPDPNNGLINGAHSQFLLGQIFEATRAIETDVREIKDDLKTGDSRMDVSERRIDKLEALVMSLRPARSRLHMALALAREIGTPREWTIGGIFAVLALKGIVAPEHLLEWARAALGLAPT